MSLGRYDSSMFVWTEDGYKNQFSIDKELGVLAMNAGQQEVTEIQNIYRDTYTGEMVTLFDSSDRVMFSVTSGQRMFWFPRIGKPAIGTAKEFYEQIIDDKQLIIPVYDNSRLISHYAHKSHILIENVVNRSVWGVQTSLGTLIFKYESVPVIFSDCG